VKKINKRNGGNRKKQKTERDERRKQFEKHPVFADFWPQIVQNLSPGFFQAAAKFGRFVFERSFRAGRNAEYGRYGYCMFTV
jgi:hypothetical protein